MRTLEDIYKVVITGNAMVGKTCLVGRYIDAKFIADTKTTIGVDFALKNIKITKEGSHEREITLQLWDFAGEERFQAVLPLYSHATQAVIFCFDATKPETIESMPSWMNVFRAGRINPVVSLCATKCDLIDEKKINNTLVEKMIKEYNIKTYIETSSLTGENVEELFKRITDELISNSSK